MALLPLHLQLVADSQTPHLTLHPADRVHSVSQEVPFYQQNLLAVAVHGPKIAAFDPISSYKFLLT